MADQEIVSGEWRWDAGTEQWVPRQDPPPPPQQPKGFAAPPPPVARRRDVWGIGQVVWGIVFVFGLSTVVGLVGILASNPDALTSSDPASDLEGAGLSTNWFLVAIVSTALTFVAWVALVARNKRLDFAADLGWGWKRSDLKFTIGLVIGGFVLDFGLVTLVGSLVQPDEADVVLSGEIDAVAGWQWVVLFLGMAVLTPIGEELFFRGLTLRAVAKRWSPTVGIVGQGVVFMLFHAGNAGSIPAMLTIFAGVGSLGILLGWAAVRTGRLGPGIVAHAFINGFVVLVSWAWG